MQPDVSLPTRRSILSAIRIAALYTACVALVFLLLFLSEGSEFSWWTGLGELAWPAAICFIVAVVVLATARRAGFTAMWVLLFGLWLWLIISRHPHGPAFVVWSILAAPLYVMCATGFRPLPMPRWVPWLVLLAWAGLATIGFANGLGQVIRFEPIRSVVTVAWMIMPFIISTLMVLRIERRG